ncbi:hypothetical protein CGCTS75_v007573 [Colletotrichum tropicale]|nr:hypothetical protein CGCTS75_v007573 [Colletotrichum tropicale]
MDLDNEHQQGNPPGSLPQRKPLSRQQRYRLNKKLRQQQAQSDKAQNNQPQGNQSQDNQPQNGQPQSNQSKSKNRANERQRQRKRLQRQQAENNRAQNGQPQPSHPQRNLPQDGQPQNSQPQRNQPKSGQRQGKAPQGNKQRNDQPPNKVLEEPPAWFGRVSRWYAEKPSVWKKRLDEVLQEEKYLSDWECNCTKKPKNCKCKQAQVLLHGEKASLNEDFLKYQKHRNGLKRALRIEAHEEAEEMKTMVQAEKAKISGIQAAIKAIKKSKGPKAKTPISISGCVYDLHCIELYQLLEDAEGCEGNEIAFFEDWETEEGTDEFDPPLPPPYTRSSGPSRYTPGTDLFAFVTLNEVVYGESAWCSNEFSGPKHAGRYIISTYGTRKSEGETMEITSIITTTSNSRFMPRLSSDFVMDTRRRRKSSATTSRKLRTKRTSVFTFTASAGKTGYLRRNLKRNPTRDLMRDLRRDLRNTRKISTKIPRNIPSKNPRKDRIRHGSTACVATKTKELEQDENTTHSLDGFLTKISRIGSAIATRIRQIANAGNHHQCLLAMTKWMKNSATPTRIATSVSGICVSRGSRKKRQRRKG